MGELLSLNTPNSIRVSRYFDGVEQIDAPVPPLRYTALTSTPPGDPESSSDDDGDAVTLALACDPGVAPASPIEQDSPSDIRNTRQLQRHTTPGGMVVTYRDHLGSILAIFDWYDISIADSLDDGDFKEKMAEAISIHSRGWPELACLDQLVAAEIEYACSKSFPSLVSSSLL